MASSPATKKKTAKKAAKKRSQAKPPAAAEQKQKPAASKPAVEKKSKPRAAPISDALKTRQRNDIKAADLERNQDCPFTENCPGKIVAYSTKSDREYEPILDEAGEPVLDSARRPRTRLIREDFLHYLHCNVCRCLPANPKIERVTQGIRRSS